MSTSANQMTTTKHHSRSQLKAGVKQWWSCYWSEKMSIMASWIHGTKRRSLPLPSIALGEQWGQQGVESRKPQCYFRLGRHSLSAIFEHECITFPQQPHLIFSCYLLVLKIFRRKGKGDIITCIVVLLRLVWSIFCFCCYIFYFVYELLFSCVR